MEHNIFTYPEFKLNYWAIPKCANTAVKLCLADPKGIPCIKQENKKHKWVHNPNRYGRSISLEDAMKNNYKNFTVTRHPYDRFISMYKDFGFRRPWTIFNKKQVSLDYFVKTVCVKWSNDLHTKNHHAFSQCFFIADNDYNLFVSEIVDINCLRGFFKKRNINPRIFNKTEVPFSINLTSEQKELIYNRYKVDFDLLGYEK